MKIPYVLDNQAYRLADILDALLNDVFTELVRWNASITIAFGASWRSLYKPCGLVPL